MSKVGGNAWKGAGKRLVFVDTSNRDDGCDQRACKLSVIQLLNCMSGLPCRHRPDE